MKLPAYPRYKPSGVEWLGEVPEHWTIWKATHAFKRIGSGTTPRSDDASYYDGDVPWVTTSELRETVITDTAAKVTAPAVRDFSALRTYPAGTLLFAMYRATIGRLGILGIPATVNQACAAFAEPLHLDTKFAYYWLQMRRPTLIVLSAGGGQPNLSQEDLRQLRIPAPPLVDQSAIASFLDRETSKVDALVAKKRTLVERLKEKRTALISRTVTRGLLPDAARAAGLDPHPKLKPSGIDWLGDVPAHWEVKRIKHLASLISKGTTPTTVGAEFTDVGVRFLKAENITEAGVSGQPEFYISQESHSLLSRSSLACGDVLVVIAGATTGKSAVLKDEFLPANTNQAVCFVRPKDKGYSEYISLWLSTGLVRNLISLNQVQSAQPNLSMEELGNIPLPVPPPKELDAIRSFLQIETSRFDKLTVEIAFAIERLQEYRTALITAAVTGKIDVRPRAAKEARA